MGIDKRLYGLDYDFNKPKNKMMLSKRIDQIHVPWYYRILGLSKWYQNRMFNMAKTITDYREKIFWMGSSILKRSED